MAANELKIDQIVQVFREIVKRKTTYNETNLHYEYFKRVGDTIPYKAHGFQSLREFLEKKAGDVFYFERVSSDLEFIAPKRNHSNGCSSIYSEAGKEQSKVVSVVKQNEPYGSGSEKSKRVLVSNNIYFGQPQSTGVNNPFQHIRNDIKVSFDFDAQKREVDRRAVIDDNTTENDSATNDKQVNGSKSISNSGDAYSLVSSRDDKRMDVDDDGADLNLPWDDKYWHLSITAAVSTNEIWARFFDPFEDRMRKMTSKLNKLIVRAAKQTRVCSDGTIYIVKDKQNCYRTIILKVESEIDQCKCFLIDIGEIKWFDSSEICKCPREFQGVLPMAMRFSLHGLVEFKENRSACEIVATELSNKIVWAKVKIKSHEFNKKNGKYDAIPVIFYDSLNRHARINLSADIMEKMVLAFKPPKLLKGRTNYVAITHISKVSGKIYGHIINSVNDLKYVNGMIEALVQNGSVRQYYDSFETETALHERLAICANTLYLIYAEYDRCWYRATILQLESNVNESNGRSISSQCNVYCFLVDYGNTRIVNLTNVFVLPGILAQYPRLSVAMALHGVTLNADKIGQLKTILQPGDNVCVDVIETINCGDSNKTNTISWVKMTKIDKNLETNQTFVCDINCMLQ